MTATLLAPTDEIIRLLGISWNTSETLLEESIVVSASRTIVVI